MFSSADEVDAYWNKTFLGIRSYLVLFSRFILCLDIMDSFLPTWCWNVEQTSLYLKRYGFPRTLTLSYLLGQLY